ncbi:hypothetical protein P9272_18865 [Mesorhizobium sp. WSM4976]|uniref:DUF6680 family protein n=1 Tax=Mesorhizobium sp. WSM4976 TaxID=3038549 RepID=UPI00241714F4|nr:DUF6680 family protein [Mesorhizobium sp. WSM4976]MDG4895633.1 hypothetical protein [Mesorhizobium sp. WSM4976]
MASHWWDIAAIIIGPMAAVAITLWYQNRDRRYQNRFDVFRSLALWRRHGLSTEFVNALNLIPVHFNREAEVMKRRRSLMDLFNDPQWNVDDMATRARLLDRRETLVAELIREIGAAVNVSIDDIEILKGAYAPQIWADQEEVTQRARRAALEILEGGRSIPVQVVLPPQTPPAIEEN